MRLIDADALGVGRCSRDILPADYCAGWNGLINIINDAPTVDAVPVVRCKDCKHYRNYPDGLCYLCAVCVEPDDFCSYGERRDDGKRGNDTGN